MGDVNHNPGCECLSCHVARERMLQEIDPIPPSGEIGRQLAEVTKRANEAFARKELAANFEISATHPLLKIMMANAERQAKNISDEIADVMFAEVSPAGGLVHFVSDGVPGINISKDVLVAGYDVVGPIVYPSGSYVPEIPVTLNMLNHADVILQAHGADVVDGELIAAIYRAMAAHAPDAIDRVKSMPSGSAMINALCDEVAAKDSRIAELKSELARRPAAFVDPDEKPEHNPFREFTKDRRMMGP